jgi:hypothetical protein
LGVNVAIKPETGGSEKPLEEVWDKIRAHTHTVEMSLAVHNSGPGYTGLVNVWSSFYLTCYFKRLSSLNLAESLGSRVDKNKI